MSKTKRAWVMKQKLSECSKFHVQPTEPQETNNEHQTNDKHLSSIPVDQEDGKPPVIHVSDDEVAGERRVEFHCLKNKGSVMEAVSC